jgi:hypothetical protein
MQVTRLSIPNDLAQELLGHYAWSLGKEPSIPEKVALLWSLNNLLQHALTYALDTVATKTTSLPSEVGSQAA